jgi:transcriptional regulator with XRE-family HTH domain
MHIQDARLAKQVTTKALAEAVGCGETMITNWQTGRKIPTTDQKRAVAAALGMDTRSIGYGEPPGGFKRRLVRKSGNTPESIASLGDIVPAMPDTVAGVRVKNAKQATDRVRAEVAETPLIKGRIDPNGRLGITGGTFEVFDGTAPEAFDSSTWSVIRRMIETIVVDEAIRRLMLAH